VVLAIYGTGESLTSTETKVKQLSLMSKSDVSIIIPCYNHGEYLSESIDSCRKQSRAPREIIVVDDASSDPGTKEILGQLRGDDLTVIRLEKNGGVSQARNEGIAAAAGSMILPLDADDRLEPDFIEEAVPILENDARCGVVYSQGYYFGAEEGIVPIPSYQFPGILLDPYIFSVGLFRKQDWKKVGGYSTSMKEAWEDYEFWISIIELGRTVHQIPKPLIGYRRHELGSRDNWVNSVDRRVELHKRIFELHKDFYCKNIDVLFRNHVENEGLKQARETLAPRTFRPEMYHLGENITSHLCEEEIPRKKWTTVSFPLQGEWREEDTVRLDPMNNPGFGRIGRITLWREKEKVHEVDFPLLAERAVFHGAYLVRAEEGLFFSCGVDPQIWIPWNLLVTHEIEKPDRIEFELYLDANFFDTVHAMQRTAKVLAKGRYGLVSLEDDVDAYQRQLIEELSRRRMNASGSFYKWAKGLEDVARVVALACSRFLPLRGERESCAKSESWMLIPHRKNKVSWHLEEEQGKDLIIETDRPLEAVWLETSKGRMMGLPMDPGFCRFRFATHAANKARLRYTNKSGRRHTAGWLVLSKESKHRID